MSCTFLCERPTNCNVVKKELGARFLCNYDDKPSNHDCSRVNFKVYLHHQVDCHSIIMQGTADPILTSKFRGRQSLLSRASNVDLTQGVVVGGE